MNNEIELNIDDENVYLPKILQEEQKRQKNEAQRVQNEAIRNINENQRKSNETLREYNETVRNENEQKRKQQLVQIQEDVDKLKLDCDTLEERVNTHDNTVDEVNTARGSYNLLNERLNANDTEVNSIKDKLNKKIYYFTNIEEMKKCANLKAEDVCQTLGYYEADDGGQGLYQIVDDDTLVDDGGSIHDLVSGLKAKLIVENNTVNVKQFGAKGDGITNDTVAFNNAFNKETIIYILESENSYLIDYLLIPANKTLIGIGKPKINIYRNTNTIMSGIKSNSIMKNLYINSLDESLEWNRFSVENCSNILIENCKFEGFRHNSDAPNSWGNYLSNCFNIRIIDCEYNNNTQSDIAIVDSVEDVIINNCKGTEEIFHINFEPNGTQINKNIVVNKCKISQLSLLENTYLVHSLENITIKDCIINNLSYRGANVSFINCKIKNILPQSTFGGIINNFNSYGYGKQLNDDPYFLKIAPSGNDTFSNWIVGYSPNSNNLNAAIDDLKKRHIQLNPLNQNTIAPLYKDFNVEKNKVYAIRTLMNTKTGDIVSWPGFAIKVAFYDSDNKIIEKSQNICIDRNSIAENESEWSEKTVLFKTPNNTYKVRTFVGNTQLDSTGKCRANFGYFLLNEIIYNSNVDDKSMETYITGDLNTDAISMIGATNNKNCAGDIIYSKDVATSLCRGYICTVAGNSGSWKKFGALSD